MKPRKRVERPGVRDGYDRWAETYDATPNPLVALDRRHTLQALNPRPGEWVLDAGCGTGGHLGALCSTRARPVGLDFSHGMLGIAQRRAPGADLLQADLNRIEDAGFRQVSWQEYPVDDLVVRAVPKAAKYKGRRLLLLVCATRSIK